MTEENKTKEEEVIAKLDTFDELPDAPPKRRIKLSWVGNLSVGVLGILDNYLCDWSFHCALP